MHEYEATGEGATAALASRRGSDGDQWSKKGRDKQGAAPTTLARRERYRYVDRDEK